MVIRETGDVAAGTVRAVEAAVRAVDGVVDAAIVVRPEARPVTGRHLADLLPAPYAGRLVPDQPAAVEPVAATPEPTSASGSGSPPGGAGGARAVLHGGPGAPDSDFPATLPQALVRAARTSPHGVTFLRPDRPPEHLTYRGLLDEATAVAAGLRDRGCRPGDSVIFQFADNRAFVVGFWACVLARLVPTPVALASRHTDATATARLRGAWRLLDQPLILTDLDPERLAAELAAAWAEPVRVAAPVPATPPAAASSGAGLPTDPVLNLLTSGSTGVPKCVRHNHRSLVARTWADIEVNRLTADEVTLTLSPLDHVMGSVMSHLRNVFLGCAEISPDPSMFAARPLRMLDWTDQYAVTNLAVPNFAFGLVANALRAAGAEPPGWDLASLRLIYNAGEPVTSATAQAFLRLLAPYRLPPDAMVPSWGMSETASVVTQARLSATDPDLGVVAVQRATLADDLRPARPGAADAVTFASVGPPLPGVSLRVVDADGAVLPRWRIGRLEITGATMMAEYHRNEAANAEAYTADGWFRTGDLAFVTGEEAGGELVITGREKDVIIVNGVNYPSHEIEAAVGQLPGVRATFAAACGVFDPQRGTDRVVVFCCPEDEGATLAPTLVDAVRAVALSAAGVTVDEVVPLTVAEFPRTPSGKIQRSALAARFRAGEFTARLRAVEVAREAPTTLPPWFLTPRWAPASIPPASRASGGAYLLLTGGPGGAELAGALRQALAGVPVVAVPIGTQPGELRPDDDAGYRRRIRTTLREHGRIAGVVHAVVPSRHPATAPEAGHLRERLRFGVLSVVRLIQALAGEDCAGTDLVVAARFAAPVAPHAFDVAAGALPGLVRAAAAESALRTVRLVDPGSADPGVQAARIVAELGVTDDEPVVAYRSQVRVLPRYDPVRPPDTVGSAFADGGLYLVTGGLGGIGQLLSGFLLGFPAVRLVLLGRAPAPDQTDGIVDSPHVRYAAGDVAEPATVRAAIGEGERAFGMSLAGVLHLAGESVRDQWDDPAAHLVRNEPVDRFEWMLHARAVGAAAVAEALRDRPDARLVLCSSLTGYLGGAGYGAYGAANSFLDGFAAYLSEACGRPAQALALSQLADVGMNRGAPTVAAAAARGLRPMSAAQGLASFLAAMALGHPQLLIGADTRNADVVSRLVPSAVRPGVLVAFAGDPGRAGAVQAAARDVLGPAAAVRAVHVARIPRRTGAVDHEALLQSGAAAATHAPPRNRTEAAVAQVCAEVFGRPAVGREENFFDFGGGSMLLMRLAMRLTEELGTSVPVRQLYVAPTVSAVATLVDGGD